MTLEEHLARLRTAPLSEVEDAYLVDAPEYLEASPDEDLRQAIGLRIAVHLDAGLEDRAATLLAADEIEIAWVSVDGRPVEMPMDYLLGVADRGEPFDPATHREARQQWAATVKAYLEFLAAENGHEDTSGYVVRREFGGTYSVTSPADEVEYTDPATMRSYVVAAAAIARKKGTVQ